MPRKLTGEVLDPATEPQTRAVESKRQSFSDPPALYRSPLRVWSSSDFAGDQWRFLVGQAPIVRSCVTTISMYLISMDWYLDGEDQDAVAYYTDVLEGADEGRGWSVYLARIADDCMTMPFGGATEQGLMGEAVAWTAHVDAGTMRPIDYFDFSYAQTDPWGARDPVLFRDNQIGRVRWMPETALKRYEWTRTPAADCIPSIQALVRADRFWQSLLLDTPPAGILDLMDMTEQEARDWYDSWKVMLSGEDGFKVPVLYGGGTERKTAAQWIKFNESPVQIALPEVMRSYIQQVCSCFGLTTGDLGIDVQNLRLAGATKLVDLTKRQGPGNVAKAVKTMIDMDILPDGVEFKWQPIDSEDALRKATGKMQEANAIAALVGIGAIPSRLAELSASALGIVPQEAVDAYNAELEGQAGPVEEAPEDATPSGDQEETRAIVPDNSRWAKRMRRVAEKLLAPSKRGFTKARLKALIDAGIAAFNEGRSFPARGNIERTKEEALAILTKKLAKETWWQSPNLTNEVFEILTGAYEEGIHRSILAAGGRIAPTSINLTNEAVLEQLKTYAGEFITGIDKSTQDMIVSYIMAGVEKGASSPDIAKSIVNEVQGALVERWKGRTEVIVGTEIGTAESHAAKEQYQRIGLTKKEWRAIPGHACEICLANQDAGAVEMEYMYESAWGEEIEAPLAHPHCVCFITFSKSELKGLGESPDWWLGS